MRKAEQSISSKVSARSATMSSAMTALKRGGQVAAAVSIAAVVAARVYRSRNRMDLRGRSVLITGGSRGLGFALAGEFLDRGARVALCARDEAELAGAKRQLENRDGTLAQAFGEVHTVVCDLRNAESVAQMMEEVRLRFGAIDVLVNNAGVIQVGPWQTMTEHDYQEAMELYFWAPLRCMQAAAPHMIRRGEGRIVNISSIGGLVAIPHLLPYTAAKFALTGLSEGWRAELHRHGIRVTTVCPGLMRTGSQHEALFKGQSQREFAWFAAGGANPLLAISAQRAARRIVEACREGRAQIVLSLPAQMLAFAHGVAPGLVSEVMALANRALPEAGGSGKQALPGRETSPALGGILHKAVERQGRKYNQHGREVLRTGT